MNEIQKGVKDFMGKAGQTVKNKPTEEIGESVKILRVKLLLEEVLEFAEASGIDVKIDLNGQVWHLEDLESDFKYEETNEVCLEDVADAFADISYVNYGAALAYGIDLEPIEKIVQEANMAKFEEGSYRRDDGKWMKPPNWEDPAPKIKAEIKKQSKQSKQSK